jgi:hypothetical protein
MPNPENIEPYKMKKGETLNPNGRPRKLISGTIKQLKEQGVKEATATEIKGVYLMLVNLSKESLMEVQNDKDQPILVHIVAKAILQDKGFDIIERMLDRSIGRAQQSIDHTTKGEAITEIKRTIIDPSNEHQNTKMGDTAT